MPTKPNAPQATKALRFRHEQLRHWPHHNTPHHRPQHTLKTRYPRYTQTPYLPPPQGQPPSPPPPTWILMMTTNVQLPLSIYRHSHTHHHLSQLPALQPRPTPQPFSISLSRYHQSTTSQHHPHHNHHHHLRAMNTPTLYPFFPITQKPLTHYALTRIATRCVATDQKKENGETRLECETTAPRPPPRRERESEEIGRAHV